MDVYRTLTKQIQKFYLNLKQSNAFYSSVFKGDVSQDQISQLMLDLTYLTSQTPPHLKAAIEESEKRGDKQLADFFRTKMEEEVGHDAWGKEDVRNISAATKTPKKQGEVSMRMRELVADNLKMIKEDPYQYFIYILFAEYFTVIGTPEFVKVVQASCGVPPAYMSIITNHAELDKDHVKHWAKEMRELGEHRYTLAQYQAVMKRVCDRYDFFASGLAISRAA